MLSKHWEHNVWVHHIENNIPYHNQVIEVLTVRGTNIIHSEDFLHLEVKLPLPTTVSDRESENLWWREKKNWKHSWIEGLLKPYYSLNLSFY